MPRNWLAVVCAAHVRRGVAGGFMQVCHGKVAPLRKIQPGDRVVYYSPTETMGARIDCRRLLHLGKSRRVNRIK